MITNDMTMKKRLIGGTLVLTTIATLAAVLMGSTNMVFLKSTAECSACSGNHYDAIAATETSIGCKEFWRCCQCHNIYLNTSEIPGYASAHWNNAGTYHLSESDVDDVRFVRRTAVNANMNVTKIRTGYNYDLYKSAETYSGNLPNYNNKYNFYKDNTAQEISYASSKLTINTVWQGTKVYIIASDNSGKEVTITNEYNSDVVKFTGQPSGKGDFVIDVGRSLNVDDEVFFNFTVDGVTRTAKLTLTANTAETTSVTRQLFTAKKTKDEIVVDGIKDECYNNTQTININSLCQGKTNVWGNGYICWDETHGFFYILYEVADSSIDTTSNASNFENDCVEFWISTCRTLPNISTDWGSEENRGDSWYCGEGGFKLRAGQSNINGGAHWMYDDGGYSGAYTKTSYGYNVEMKIPFKSFFDDKHKGGSIIDFAMLITDGKNNACAGKVGNNSDANLVWWWGGNGGPSRMDHLLLVA